MYLFLEGGISLNERIIVNVIPAPTKKKIKVGRPYYDHHGQLCYFVAHCNECGGKCLATKDDARYIATHFAKNYKPFRRRIINYLEKREG